MKLEILARIKNPIFWASILMLIANYLHTMQLNKDLIDFIFNLLGYFIIGHGIANNYTLPKEGDEK